ncbi:hypothetical protein EV421DRAFT_1288644 [Armillaria borealis]|uniref:Uncharacterized protein n=1 Tax=Armillaria borealis TaxID=47425 RepID=A0AA39JVU4_9AGAR|nr:hypothetical protein EV421DRAFT_1288644 [Armillaria borealis]
MHALKKLKKDHAFTLTHLLRFISTFSLVLRDTHCVSSAYARPIITGVITPQALANCRDRLQEPYASANGTLGTLSVSVVRILSKYSWKTVVSTSGRSTNFTENSRLPMIYGRRIPGSYWWDEGRRAGERDILISATSFPVMGRAKRIMGFLLATAFMAYYV